MAYLDENQIGEVTEITGDAVIIRTDGTEEPVTLGTAVFEGDIVETSGEGAVNIGFIDDSSFAVSKDARIAIDEFVFDPASEAGAQDFSVARGVFMYTSGLIGRENPDSVEIDTPVGSIGIRGTIIGGNIDPEGESQVTVVEGAIVVRNNGGEQLLTSQFDTVRLTSMDAAPSDVETLTVDKVANDYGAIKNVSSALFSSFDDQMNEEGPSNNLDESSVSEDVQAEGEAEAEAEAEAQADETQAQAQEQVQEQAKEQAEKSEKKVELKSAEESKTEASNDVSDAKTSDTKANEPAAKSAAEGRDTVDLNQIIDVRRFQRNNDVEIELKSGGSVDENSLTATVVGQVGPSRDVGYTLEYSLSGADSAMFDIDPATGVITLAANAADYETAAKTHYDVQVVATRAGTNSSKTTNLRIELNDLNDENPASLQLDNSSVAENVSGLIGNLSASDADVGDHLTYTLKDDASGLFEVDGTQLKLKSGAQLDHETATSHTVTVLVTDAAGNTAEQDFTISVSDVNEIAEITGVSNETAVSEGTLANDVVVADLAFTEVDGSQTTSFSVSDNRFDVIDDNGQLKLIAKSGSVFDFETASALNVTISQTDGSNTYDNIDVSVQISDLIDETPTNLQLDNLSADESSAGVVVGILSASDADASDSLTYSVSNDPSNLFEIDGTQLKLKAGAQLDFETAESHTVEVTVTDSANHQTTQSFTIIVNDLNDENPASLQLDNSSVAEDASGLIGNLSATDADAGDQLTYTLTDDASGLFEVDGTQLKLISGAQLDHETAQSHTVTVLVTDAAGNTAEQDFTISVSDVNEIAEITAVSNETAVSEGTLANDVVVADLAFTEVDGSQTTTFVTNDARFQVVNNSGQLQLIAVSGAEFDFETDSSLIVTISQSDGSNTYDNIDVTVQISDLIDETPTGITLDNTAIDENVASGTTVATLTTTDADAGDSHTYTISNDASGLFEIVGNEIRLKAGATVDYETAQSHSFDLTTSDLNGLEFTQNVTIDINNINEIFAINIALEDVFDGVGVDAIGVVGMGKYGVELGALDIEGAEGLNLSDFVISGNYVDGDNNPQSLSDIFEVVMDGDQFVVKMRDEYRLMNTNQIHNADGQLGSVQVDANNTFQLDVEVDGTSFTMEYAIRWATYIEDTHSQGVWFNLQNVDGTVIGTDGVDNFVVGQNDSFYLIRGGKGYDTIILDNDAGSGTKDVLDFRSTGSNLDGFGMDLSGIEEILLSMGSNNIDNTLKMNVSDLLDLLKTSDYQVAGKNAIKITAANIWEIDDKSDAQFYTDNGAKINSLTQYDGDASGAADFTWNGTVTENGHTYNILEHELGNILLDQNLKAM